LEQSARTLQTALTARRQQEEATAALAAFQQDFDKPGFAAAALADRLATVTRLVQALPAGAARTALEATLKACATRLSALPTAPAILPPHKAGLLRLVPKNSANAALRPLLFVTRARLLIGRKPAEGPAKADLLTPTAEKRISRVHVSLLRQQGKVQILSGAEGQPSLNPALLDETMLTNTPTPLPLDREHRIDLAGVLTLRVRHLPGAAICGPKLDESMLGISGGATVVMPLLAGCLRLQPFGEDKLPQPTVWLFTDATLGSASTGALPLPDLAAEQARLHFWRDAFWIESLAPGVQLEGQALATGIAHPLRPGMELRLGAQAYTVELAA